MLPNYCWELDFYVKLMKLTVSEVNFSLKSKVGVYDALEELIIPQSLKVMIPPGPWTLVNIKGSRNDFWQGGQAVIVSLFFSLLYPTTRQR